MTDNFDINCVKKILNNFSKYYNSITELNKILTGKKIRYPNFPSEISENIAKIIILKKKNIISTWNCKKGDLETIDKQQIEIKAFTSTGPSSFGPTEKWYRIYFLDCTNFLDDKFKLYEINLSNDDEKWKNIKINKTQTYNDQCLEKRRPRIPFKNIKEQILENCSLIFDGNINEL